MPETPTTDDVPDPRVEALLRRFRDDPPPGADTAGMLQRRFVQALQQRLAGQAAPRLYGQTSRGEQIRRFELLRTQFPFVVVASLLANRAMASAVGGHAEATIVDIGIGNGAQFEALIDVLARDERLPRSLDVVALDPDRRSLQAARERLTAAASRCRIELRFTEVDAPIERALPELGRAVRDSRGPRAINAAFALHHINPAAAVSRQDVLDAVAGLDPAVFVLTEPHADHATVELATRARNAWVHYGALFRTIDRLAIRRHDADGLKRFFCREIDDILSAKEPSRQERHEPTTVWVERIRRAGLRLEPTGGVEDALIDVSTREGAIQLSFEGEPLVGIMVAKPRH